MSELETSVEIADEPTSDHPEDDSQPSVEDFVTKMIIHEKELSLVLEHDRENSLHQVWSRDEDSTLSDVAETFGDIQEWVEDIDDEEWELSQFRLETTIAAQCTEETENSLDETGSGTETSLTME